MKRGDLVFTNAEKIFSGRKIVSIALFWREEDEIRGDDGISVRLEDGIPLVLIDPPYESKIIWSQKKLVRVFHYKYGFLTGENQTIRKSYEK
jgi:hypothetical protein